MDYGRAPLADRLAAEYVLGTLRGAARRRFESLLPAHPVLRHAVDEWRARLMPLTLALEPVVPPVGVWRGIEERLFADAAVPARLAATGRRRGLVAAGAAVLAVVLLRPGAEPPPTVSVLASTGATLAGAVVPPTFIATLTGDRRTLVTRPAQPLEVPPRLALQLWSVPPVGAPRSLGLVSAQEPTVLRPDPAPDARSMLAVSLEPAGGSTTGAPSGPVLWRASP